MSRWKSATSSLVALGLICAASTASAQQPDEGCTPHEQAGELPNRLLDAVFPPEPGGPIDVACAFGSDPCDPWLDRTGVVIVPPQGPGIVACRDGGANGPSLQACYNRAALLTRAALDTGDLAGLNEAFIRTGDVIKRARAEQAGPQWLRDEAPHNLLANVFLEVGLVPSAVPPACNQGSADDRYACMADNPAFAGRVRQLVDAGRNHLGRVAREGAFNDAQAQALGWFQSAAAPQMVRTARSGLWAPEVATPPGVDLLGEYFALRVLSGAVYVDDGRTEAELLGDIGVYAPSPDPFDGLWTAKFAIAGAQLQAIVWDAEHKRGVMGDPLIAHETTQLLAVINAASETAGAMGMCVVADELAEVYLGVANTKAVPMAQMALLDGPIVISEFMEQLLGLAESAAIRWMWGGGAGEALCDWVRYDQVLYAVSAEPDTYLEVGMNSCDEGDSYTCPDGTTGTITECEDCRTYYSYGGGKTFTDLECWAASDHSEYLATIKCPGAEWTTEISDYDDFTGLEADILARTMVVTSIRGAYRDLLDNYDHDSTPWFVIDLDHANADPAPEGMVATIANAAVNATYCFAEAGTLFSPDSSAEWACDSETTDTDCYANDVSMSGMIPYPIAVRVCPTYVARVVGLLENDTNCVTPWGYVEAVSTFVRYAEPLFESVRDADYADDGWYTGMSWGDEDESATWQSEDGETLETTLIDFANEALLMASSTAGVYNKRARLAGVVGELPSIGGSSDDSILNGEVGLDFVAEWLDGASYILGRGVEVFNDYDTVDDLTATTLTHGFLTRSIPRRALKALNGLTDGDCDGNSLECGRGLLHQRVADLLSAIERVRAAQFKLLWRKADGVDRCLVADEDGTSCDDSIDGCADRCAPFDDAIELVADVNVELDTLDAILAAHGSWLSVWGRFSCVSGTGWTGSASCFEDTYDLAGYVSDLRARITLVRTDLDNRLGAMAAGVDWLGFRGGRQVTGGGDPDGRVDELFGEIETALSGSTYSDYISSYLAQLRDQGSFATQIATEMADTDLSVAYYCIDTATSAPAPDGCAIDETWSSTHLLVAKVNQLIIDNLCNATISVAGVDYPIGISSFDEMDPTDASRPELYETYQSLMTALGVSTWDVNGDGDLKYCPQLTSPDFDAWDEYGGILAEDLDDMEAVLRTLGYALQMLGDRTADVGYSVEAWMAYNEDLTDSEVRAYAINVFGSYFGCVGGIISAVASMGASSSGAINTCTDFLVLTDPTPEWKLNETWRELQLDIYTDAQLSALNGEIFDTIEAIFVYEDASEAYRADVATLTLLERSTEERFRALYSNAFVFDPTNLLFADEQLAQVEIEFTHLASLLREVQKTIAFDIGVDFNEGQIYTNSDPTTWSYYLPRLSDITIYGPYGVNASDVAGSYGALAGASEGAVDDRQINLASMASLLYHLYGRYRTAFGRYNSVLGVDDMRQYEDAFLVGTTSEVGLDEDDLPNNMGEWAMLSRSPFFNETLGSGDCGAGYVDAGTYCPDDHDLGECIDLANLSDRERRNLAWLDHMVRGSNNTFECYLDDDDTTLLIRSAAGSSATAVFTEAFLEVDDATESEWLWLNESLQTDVVQGLMAELAVTIDSDGGTISEGSVNLQPGDYLVAVDLSTGWLPDTPEQLDMERDLLVGGQTAVDTMVEQIEAVALICTDEHACGGGVYQAGGTSTPSAQNSWILFAGPTRQTDICVYEVTAGDERQEQNRYEMENTVHLSGDEWTINASMDANHADAAEHLWDDGHGTIGGLPLQVDQIFIGIGGVGDDATWSLYASSTDTDPAVRLGLRYSYYATAADPGADVFDVEDTITCTRSDACVIGTSCP